MTWKEIDISLIRSNPDNPRTIDKNDLKKLAESVKKFPKMLQIRPIVINKDMQILGGNQRFEACKMAGFKTVPIVFADDLTEEEQQEFIIKDNVSAGKWDMDLIKKMDLKQLEEWGLVVDIKDTERLSDMNYDPIYFIPKEHVYLDLEKCLNLDKFHAKCKVIDESNLPEEKKQILKNFAYRFIKIDFEMVANYYSFHASPEEKEVIERLRLVLIDNGSLGGFIEDDLLRIMQVIDFDEPEND